MPEPASQNEPAARVLRPFRSVVNAMKTHFQQVERAAGVGGAKAWAVSVIQAQSDIGFCGLTRATDVHQTTASNQDKALGTSELVLASRDDAGHRATRLRAAPRGARVLEKAPGPIAGMLPESPATFEGETLARLDNDLGKPLALPLTDERAAGIPLAQIWRGPGQSLGHVSLRRDADSAVWHCVNTIALVVNRRRALLALVSVLKRVDLARLAVLREA